LIELPVSTNLLNKGSPTHAGVIYPPPILICSYSKAKVKAASESILAVSLYPGSSGKVKVAFTLAPYSPTP